MAIPGERFVLDLSDDDDEIPQQPPAMNLTNLVGEIKERTPKVPSAPTLKSSTGFPTSKNRLAGSAFKQQQRRAKNAPAVQPRSKTPNAYQQQQSQPRTSTLSQSESREDEEKRIIDEENRHRIATMSEEEIESERAELMANLSPSLIERLLRRANIDDEVAATVIPSSSTSTRDQENKDGEPPKKTGKSVSFDVPDAEHKKQDSVSQPDRAPSLLKIDPEDQPPTVPPSDLRPASEFPSGPIHFPTPPPRQNPMPNLDPTSPSFYDDLQAHYFPDIPHDSSALSWLKPAEKNNTDDPRTLSAYNPSSSTTQIVPSGLRFSFRGELLPPSKALELPTSLGLHHHADDPEAAGYTISELSILSRSTLPAQRCIAWQVLGRILFRLGTSEFGASGTDLVEGLWKVIEHENVVSRMLEEAEGGSIVSQEKPQPGDENVGADTGFKSNIGRHASAKAWAVEGIWLWQKGGGNRGITNVNA